MNGAVESLKGLAHVINRIDTLPNLSEGTVVVFEVKKDVDFELHDRLCAAMDDLFGDSGIVVLMVPEDVLSTVRAMPLHEVLSLREALDEVIATAHEREGAEA